MKIEDRVVNRIEEALSGMSAVEHKIACYILENQEKVVYMTVKEIAHATGVSEGSIIKFSAKLGYTGFSELKISLAKEGKAVNYYTYDSIEEKDSPKNVMYKMIENTVAALKATYEVLSEDTLRRIAEILSKEAKRIEIYGVGSSAPIAQDIYFRMMRMGLPAYSITDPHVAAVSASLLKGGDVAIGISHSGRSMETLEAMKKASDGGVVTIGITSYAKSPLAEICDYTLSVTSRESVMHEESVTARLAQLLIFDSICAYIGCQMGEISLEYKKNVEEIIDSHRKVDDLKL